MDHHVELRFQKLKAHLETDFGPNMDMAALLFLVGVNELGMGHRTFSKQEKMELMHIAICTLLEPFGYYTFNGRDADLWPHFILNQELPALNHQEQQQLLKEALLEYFVKNEYYHEELE
ncbi:MAG: hypothetical protein RLZZ301_138 [Bacteroidota bacterium]|jgi:hypothetical protein